LEGFGSFAMVGYNWLPGALQGASVMFNGRLRSVRDTLQSVQGGRLELKL
jgi:hypothetical protein